MTPTDYAEQVFISIGRFEDKKWMMSRKTEAQIDKSEVPNTRRQMDTCAICLNGLRTKKCTHIQILVHEKMN